MKTVVTIGVCVRNSASTIREAIESIISQDFLHELMEVIFVDDGSTDGTLSIIQEYVSRMGIHAKIFHSSWQGLGVARNFVIENAEGKYIVWVDGDMILPKDHVRKQIEFMASHPKVAIAGGSFGMWPQASLIAILDNLVYVVHRLKYGEKSSNLPGTGGAIYRVESIKQVGGFDENIRGSGEDIDVAYRVKSAGWLVVRDKALFYGRCKETWKELWNQYFWHGYGAHYVFHKDKGLICLYKMVPPASFLVGVTYTITAYKLTCRKAVFALPLHFIFKNIAWCLGFAKAHIDGWKHKR